MKLSIVMPVYNEMASIQEVIRRVLASPLPKELIIVDDGSTDGTREHLKTLMDFGKADVRVFFAPTNQGKGAALRRGFEAVTGDIVIIQDADLEYNPAEYAQLIAPILENQADVVYGSRFMSGRRRVLYFWHTVGNALLTTFSNMCTNLNLTDMETGFKAFRREVIHRLDLKSDRFGCEPEITAKIARLNFRVYEVPISYSGREYWEGKKINWRDGVAAIVQIMKYSFFDRCEKPQVGKLTLERMTRAHRYNKWIMAKAKAFLGPRVLEAGSGTGNLTRYLIDRECVVATDVNPDYLSILTRLFERYPHVSVMPFDLITTDLEPLKAFRFTTVFSSNVLEHVEDDQQALHRLYQVIEPGGRIVLVLPSLQALFGSLDVQLGHHRRYDKKSIGRKLQAAGFEVESIRYFNVVGILGWFVNGRILRRKIIPSVQLRFFDKLVPWLRSEDALNLPFGMSMVAVGRKP